MPQHLAKIDPEPELPYASRVGIEFTSASIAAFLVSPLVSIIDKSIVKRVSSGTPLTGLMWNEFKVMISKPVQFLRSPSFLMTFGVYWGTYIAANMSEVISDYMNIKQKRSVKVTAATIANVGLLNWRDTLMVRLYATNNPPVTLTSKSMFAVRDFATMMATFYAAPALATHLNQNYNVKKSTADLTCALLVPTIVQAITSPLHMIAIDISNRPAASDRFVHMVKNYSNVTFGRCLRILPAFGLGSRTNSILRDHFYQRSALIHKNQTSN